MYVVRRSPNILAHHGIKGMHWGIRRFQSYETVPRESGKGGKEVGEAKGLRDRLRERREKNKIMNTYVYRNSDTYINASRGQKTYQTNQHNKAETILEKKTANRIDYKVNNEGADFKKEFRKEYTKQTLTGFAAIATIAATPALINAGKNYFNKINQQAYIGRSMTAKVGTAAGLNTVKGGFTFGFKGFSQNVEVGKRYMKAMGLA